MNLKFSAPLELSARKSTLITINCQGGVLCLTEYNSIYSTKENQVVVFLNILRYIEFVTYLYLDL